MPDSKTERGATSLHTEDLPVVPYLPFTREEVLPSAISHTSEISLQTECPQQDSITLELVGEATVWRAE